MLLAVPVVGGHRRVGLDKGIVVLWFRIYVCMHVFSIFFFKTLHHVMSRN